MLARTAQLLHQASHNTGARPLGPRPKSNQNLALPATVADRQQAVTAAAACTVMEHHTSEVLSETPQYQRYLTVYNRRVKLSVDGGTTSHEVDYDVVGHPKSSFLFTVVFPFHPYTDGREGGEVTVIREYAQGVDAMMYGLPTGGFDAGSHADMLACAQAELSEEAMLHAAQQQWHRLLPDGHPGMSEVKWCRNRFVPFLVIDPQPDLCPGTRDAEEVTIQVLRVSVTELQQLLVSGDMSLPSVTTCFLALQHLQRQGLL